MFSLDGTLSSTQSPRISVTIDQSKLTKENTIFLRTNQNSQNSPVAGPAHSREKLWALFLVAV